MSQYSLYFAGVLQVIMYVYPISLEMAHAEVFAQIFTPSKIGYWWQMLYPGKAHDLLFA